MTGAYRIAVSAHAEAGGFRSGISALRWVVLVANRWFLAESAQKQRGVAGAMFFS